ncbi:MAG: ABC-F family ATP-binding cassette domain-containing protein [Sporichthyaceae bacterium]
MSNLVNLETVSKSYGVRPLLDGVSLGLSIGERIGVVGRNGAGKSTLLRLLARTESPDAGRVTHLGGLRVAMVTQADELDPAMTLRQAVVGERAEHSWASDARVRDVFTGLLGGVNAAGFTAGLDTVVGPCSGGERRRIALARALVAELDLLVLDEPTNHLDVEGITWLARHLVARPTALLVVTHDRWFLDEVCTRTWEVEGGAVNGYDGGYAAYVLAKAERNRIAATEEQKRSNLVRKELAWLRRGPPARTSKPQFRIDAANALIADEPPARESSELVRFATARLGRTAYELTDITLAPGGTPLLKHLTWNLGPGERVGLVGINGSGKTSLVRLLLGELAPVSGKVKTGVTVRAAHLSQEIDELPPGERVLTCVERVARVVTIGKKEFTASSMLERFGFAADRQWTPVGDLSGGERRRLQLLRLLMAEPNVLFLDEPTNDLDIETLTALEDLLDGWPGTLLVVSHDRYFLERTTDTVWALMGDQDLRMLPGGIEEYVRRRAEAVSSADPLARSRTASTDSPPSETAAANGATNSAADIRAARKELTRIERRFARIETAEKVLHAQLADHATDYAKVAELDSALRELAVEKAELEDQWLILAETAAD